ncbi:DOMON-like domain-containing protein [Erythrobacter litoralis]|uniref:DOMON-like domain-containing protein n=1 Tax=Erythrobacter litoralis TaxID=39960 RepID=UPI0024355F89|nr:DOMON-like domain-containing protein [Erythrobacter litoralis]MDG6079540.1 DOMON-like domain-containing protein [Erythrobacter litoralis]
MQTHELTAHPAHPTVSVRSVTAKVDATDRYWLRLRWRIEGTRQILVPCFAGKRRLDGLWRTTCFELFVRAEPQDGTAYSEFNFSPSEAFAAYDFSSYRENGRDRHITRAPEISWRGGSSFAIMDVAMQREALPNGSLCFGMTAVIEEEGGQKSYWAAEHTGDAPDFHDPACFAQALAAPNRP